MEILQYSSFITLAVFQGGRRCLFVQNSGILLSFTHIFGAECFVSLRVKHPKNWSKSSVLGVVSCHFCLLRSLTKPPTSMSTLEMLIGEQVAF